MDLFVFFALPLATILLAIVLQKILRSPILVAITFFAIYLIVAFASFSDTLAEALIAAIVYTIIAYITAYIVMILCRCRRRISCNCGENLQSSDLLTVESTCFANNLGDTTTNSNINSQVVTDTANVTSPYGNMTNNVNYGVRRYYRR